MLISFSADATQKPKGSIRQRHLTQTLMCKSSINLRLRPLCLCPPAPVYKDPSPPLAASHIPPSSRPPTQTTDDESTTRFTLTFQTQAAWCSSCCVRFSSPALWRRAWSWTGIPNASTTQVSDLMGRSGSWGCSKRSIIGILLVLLKGKAPGWIPQVRSRPLFVRCANRITTVPLVTMNLFSTCKAMALTAADLQQSFPQLLAAPDPEGKQCLLTSPDYLDINAASDEDDSFSRLEASSWPTPGASSPSRASFRIRWRVN